MQSTHPSSLDIAANRMLVNLYIDIRDIPSAKELSDSLLESDPTNILYLVDAARIFRSSGDSRSAISILSKAKEYVTEESPVFHILELAGEFQSLDQFKDSVALYEKVVVPSDNTHLTHSLLYYYHHN